MSLIWLRSIWVSGEVVAVLRFQRMVAVEWYTSSEAYRRGRADWQVEQEQGENAGGRAGGGRQEGGGSEGKADAGSSSERWWLRSR